MQFVLFLTIALLLGAITPIYLSMNSSVARYVNSPILANVSFFALALLTTVIAVVFTFFLSSASEGWGVISKFKEVPLYLYLSGVFSALLILGTTALIPRLGASLFFILFVSGQVIMAVIVSHLGILGSPQESITVQKMIGVLFVVLGVVLTTLSKDNSWFSAAWKTVNTTFWGT